MRERQRAARRSAVALAYKAKRKGVRKCELAAKLALPVRTLSYWQKHASEPARVRGPKPRLATPEQCAAVVATLIKIGPQTGLPTLRALYPELTRAQLHEILNEYRRNWREEHKYPMTRLCWTTPGNVWAVDFTKPKAPIDGIFERVLVVRDLASGVTLLTLPCHAEDSDTVRKGLQSLFERHGAPLCIKSDNGGAFIEACVQGLLAAKNVQHLFSPPRCPRYNGSCERGIGELKSRAKYQAELNFERLQWSREKAELCGAAGESAPPLPDAWSSGDLQRAQSIGNEILRPWGHTRPTRIEVWNSRQAIPEEQRTRLRELRDHCRENRLAELRAAKLGPNRTVADEVRDQQITLEAALRPGAGGRSTPAPGSGQSVLETLSKHELASLERTALADALEQLGFLSYWRRQFTPPIKLKFRAKN